MEPKRQRTETNDEKSEKVPDQEKPLPLYGSKAYWDQRYQKVLETNGSNPRPEQVDANDDEPAAFHNWYFSYDDLRPILLPLVLGGKQAAQCVLGDEQEEEEEIEDGDHGSEDAPQSAINDATGGPVSNEEAVEKAQQTTEQSNDGGREEVVEEEVEEEDQDDGEEANDDGWEEASDDNNGNASDTEEADGDVSQLETGLAVKGPISVLEVGCGDAPLVVGLVKDLCKQEDIAIEPDASNAGVGRIVCTDYSPTLIDALKRLHQKKRKAKPDTDTANNNGKESQQYAIEFLEADARKLPFPDETFHLILEKGTMDAMISDPDVGVSNCIEIVSDCARVLATGGCFFLVSHINAQTEKGEQWLNDVVVTGLRKGGDHVSWSIEVHGNAATSANGNDEEAAGPAVYLIFKSEATASPPEHSDQLAIPLQFFCY